MEDARVRGRRGTPVALGAEEEAFLRRFVRRHALTGAAGKALIASVVVVFGLAVWPGEIRERPVESPPAPGVLQLGRELEALRAEALARADREGPDAATRAAVDELEERIESIAREILELRARAQARPAAPPGRASSPAYPAVSERVHRVEARQSQAEVARAKAERELLGRLHDLENRQDRRERQDLASLRQLLERVERLESSREVAETNRLESEGAILARLGALESRLVAVPAAPQP